MLKLLQPVKITVTVHISYKHEKYIIQKLNSHTLAIISETVIHIPTKTCFDMVTYKSEFVINY